MGIGADFGDVGKNLYKHGCAKNACQGQKTPSIFAEIEIGGGGIPIIRVSEARNGHVVTLLATLGHEMIHLRQFQLGDSGNHNVLFQKLAQRVCAAHGFDIKAF